MMTHIKHQLMILYLKKISLSPELKVMLAEAGLSARAEVDEGDKGRKTTVNCPPITQKKGRR